MTISELVAKYEANRSSYLLSDYNETQLRSDFLNIFFKLLGWDIENTKGKPTYDREVILEESLKESIAEHSKKPDYTFRLFSERKFFLEAKKPFVKIESDDESARQIRRYGFTAKLKISVLSNFEHLIIYDTSIKVESVDNFQKAQIKKFHYTEYISKFDEIRRLLGHESVYTGDFDLAWKSIEIELQKNSIDTLFLLQINHWRKQLGAEIYKYEPSIREDKLNDIVQSYLNRILFLRVCEDRRLEEYQTLLKFASENDFKALIKKFGEADKRFNSGLFDSLLKDKIIENISSVFWDIIKNLYYPESPYSFSVFSSDILGRIYEIFLSQKLAIAEGSVTLVLKPENVDRDIITTPTYIIHELLRSTVQVKCNGKSDKEILALKFADISCGSGAFLLEIFQLINDILIDYYLKNDRGKLVQINSNTYKLDFGIKKSILLNCIYGIDKDFNAVEATKFGLLLKLLESENITTTTPSKPILPNLENSIKFGNSLISPSQTNTSNEQSINSYDFKTIRFDAVVGNPPYMSTEDMKRISPLEFPLYKKHYKSTRKQFDKYFLFIERGLNLLTPDGLLGYIVPNKFTKVDAARNLRKILKVNKHLHSIISFGANQVFGKKSTYTCLLILSNKPKAQFHFGEVRSLKKWKIREPSSLSLTIKRPEELDENIFVLVPGHLESAFNKIINQSIPLENLVGEKNIFNGIQTSATKVYIFVPEKEDEKYYYWSRVTKIKETKKSTTTEFKIEKGFTKPYFKTGEANTLNSYRNIKPNSRVIYPYESMTKGTPTLIPLEVIKESFPEAYKYLMQHKSILNSPTRKVEPKSKTDDEWHRYGRVQGLSSCEAPQKLIVGILSSGEKYAIDHTKALVSSGGTAGYCCIVIPESAPYSIYYIQAILDSKYLEWFSSLYGEIFTSKYIARGTKTLNRLPIRKIDFSDQREKNYYDLIISTQKRLIDIQSEMDLHVSDRRLTNVLTNNFNHQKNILATTITELYNLGADEELVPTINELYEAD